MSGTPKSNTPVPHCGIQVEPSDTQRVKIHHDRLAGQWEINMPEAVGAGGVLLFYPSLYPDVYVQPINWARFSDGSLGYDWTPDIEADNLKLVETNEKSNYRFRAAVAVSVRIRPQEDRILIQTVLTNLSGETLKDVWHDGGCLQNMTEVFQDPRQERTYIRSSPLPTLLPLFRRLGSRTEQDAKRGHPFRHDA